MDRTRSKSREGISEWRGEGGGGRTVSGGKMAPLMMKPGRVGVHHTADATCPYTNRDWEGVGGGTQSTSPGEGSHCKQSLMIKGSGTTPNFQINAEELQNSCCYESFLDLRVSINRRERT